jgi:FtsH-binding integral membrane protein
VISALVRLFIQSSGLQVAISAGAVVVFTGLLAVDLNRAANSPAATQGQALPVAVNVCLDVLNLFTALLRIFSTARVRSRELTFAVESTEPLGTSWTLG